MIDGPPGGGGVRGGVFRYVSVLPSGGGVQVVQVVQVVNVVRVDRVVRVVQLIKSVNVVQGVQVV